MGIQPRRTMSKEASSQAASCHRDKASRISERSRLWVLTSDYLSLNPATYLGSSLGQSILPLSASISSSEKWDDNINEI